MLLRIQVEESLLSFIARNKFLNWNDTEVNALDRLTRTAVYSSDVKIIAAGMGWFGCYGFNRLLYHHTFYPRRSIFKESQDISYSHKEYHSQCLLLESNQICPVFCPECVKEDLKVLGFSYWRRSLRSDINVCVKHNVYLVNNCPFCGRPFNYKGHGLDVMWKGCSGHHLGEVIPVKNEDYSVINKAKFLRDIFDFGFVVPIEPVVLAVNEQLLTLNSTSGEISHGVEDDLSCRIKLAAKIIVKNSSENYGHLLGEYSDLIFDSVLFLFESFNQFLQDVGAYKCELRPVTSLWSTYRAGGSESAQYVEEDYDLGIAHWSCPYPSPRSKFSCSNDGYDRPTLYPRRPPAIE